MATNHPEDTTDVWNLCQRKAALFYVWTGCYHIGEDTHNFLKMCIMPLGKDSKVEDGWNGSPFEVDNDDDGSKEIKKQAHPRRTRKSVSKSNNPLQPSDVKAFFDNNSSLDRLVNDTAESKKRRAMHGLK